MGYLAARVESLTAAVTTFADAVGRLDAEVRALAERVEELRGPVQRFKRDGDEWRLATVQLVGYSDNVG
jgi:hypothetical protein